MPELVASAEGERKQKKKKKRKRRPPVTLPPELQKYRQISVSWAAAIMGISVDGFRRHYPHLIKQVTPRRQTVPLGEVIDED